MVARIASLVGEADRLRPRSVARPAALLWSSDDTISRGGASLQVDELGPARGIALGLMLATPFWGAVILVAVRLLH